MFVLLVLVNIVLGDVCSSAPTCSACKNLGPTCGWCSATQNCTLGSPQGPSVGKCVGRGQWNFQQCPTCATFNGDCRGCTLSNRDCAWCDQSKTCIDLTDFDTCPGAALTCPCNTYQSCSSCTLFSDGNCGWCGKSDDCRPIGTNSTDCGAVAYNCPCSNNKNCDSCLDDFNGANNNECSWCGDKCYDAGDKNCTLAALNCPAACSTYNTCGNCQQNGCAWCDATDSCVDPLTATCFVSHVCPEKHCEKFGACDTCNIEKAKGCIWCSELDACLFANDTRTKTCANIKCTEICESYSSCSSCNAVTGCAWCKKNETLSCVNKGLHSTDCEQLAECSPSSGKTGMFFLGMFVMTLIIGILVGAFVLYRKRQGRPVYTSI